MKKLRYFPELLSVIKHFKNWYELLFLVLNKNQHAVMELRTGEKFIVRHYLDLLTILEIFARDEYKITRKKLRTIIDIGGNIGTFSVSASIKNPKAIIYSFEPDPLTFSILQANIALNQTKNVNIANLAIAAKNSSRTFYSHSASGLSSFSNSRKGSKSTTVKAIKLDKFLADSKIAKVDFLKIDCEGAEYEIIEAMPKQTAKKIKAMAIEYHDRITKHTHDKLLKDLKSLGFRTKLIAHPIEKDIGIIYATR